MVRGLIAPFKEIIYYNFDAILLRERGRADMDLKLLGEIIERVERAGGYVRSVTLDMGNRKLLSECKVSTEWLILEDSNQNKLYNIDGKVRSLNNFDR